jgi:hypothetical protein
VNNAVYAYTGLSSNKAITPDTSPAGYVELVDFTSPAADSRLETMWNTGQDTSPATSWSGGAAALIGAVEIKAAVSAGLTAIHSVSPVRW